MAQVGVEPTASLVLSEGGLPALPTGPGFRRLVKDRSECPGGVEPTSAALQPAAWAVRPRARFSAVHTGVEPVLLLRQSSVQCRYTNAPNRSSFSTVP